MLNANTGPSSVANYGLIFVFDIRHLNRYIATEIRVNRCRLSAARNFEEHESPPKQCRGIVGPELEKIKGLKPIIDHNNGTDGLKK
jgi:hypothetical protein